MSQLPEEKERGYCYSRQHLDDCQIPRVRCRGDGHCCCRGDGGGGGDDGGGVLIVGQVEVEVARSF